MDPLDFKTNEELLFFFHRKKTEISCIDQPHILLTQLRDHDLLPEKLFENVKKMCSREQKEKGFYEVLDWVEKNRCQDIHQFWRCVFEDHILQLYPTIRKLKNSLLDGTFNLYEKPPDVETLTEEEKSEGKAKKGEEKSYTRKRTSPVKKGDKQEIWKWPIYKTQLPVTCGDKEGTLYRDKLPEGEKCILSQGRWFTPAGFEKFGGKERCKNWKNSIRCRNITLKKLIEDGHLQCPQRKSRKKTCVQKNMNERFPVSSNMSSSKECYVCRSEGDLVCCDECLQAFHSHCHLPAVHGDSPGEWICSFCMLRNSQQWCDPSNMSEQKAFNAPVSQYIWHCHCFLLCAYREDTQKVFVKDPRQKVSRYSEFISQPMWLDRIKQKLESGEYQTVRAFVSDFQLIFRNCSMFNRDNEFGRMGARLKQILEEEFQKIFKMAVFTPKILKGNDKDKHKNVYRFVCPCAGQFRCSLTSLVFVMEGEGEVLYNTVSWDPRLLDGLGVMQPAGPLYDIKCFNGSISGLHLPHCEIFSEGHMDCLAVAHITNGNIAIMNPLKVTEAHVMIDIKDLSIFGLIKRMIFPPSPVVAQVLVFLRPISVRQEENILDVHLLPWNVPLSEVKDQHAENTHIQTSSKCYLTPGTQYCLCCQPEGSTVQPATEEFEFNFGPNYHPTFEVFVNVRNKEVKLSLTDNTEGREVWFPRRLLLTGQDEELPVDRRLMGSEFMNKNRCYLIQRVLSVMAIADGLMAKGMISPEIYDQVNAKETRQDKMRALLDVYDAGGASVKAEFYRLLKENEPRLVDELDSGPSRPQ